MPRGGAYSYLVDGKMIGGFALIAIPAEYGRSGVMTFIVNHDGDRLLAKTSVRDTATAAQDDSNIRSRFELATAKPPPSPLHTSPRTYRAESRLVALVTLCSQVG